MLLNAKTTSSRGVFMPERPPTNLTVSNLGPKKSQLLQSMQKQQNRKDSGLPMLPGRLTSQEMKFTSNEISASKPSSTSKRLAFQVQAKSVKFQSIVCGSMLESEKSSCFSSTDSLSSDFTSEDGDKFATLPLRLDKQGTKI